jgi:hypothetical protein
MITSRIDWGGFIGPIGSIYILDWNEDDERPVDGTETGQYVIEKPDGSKVAIARDESGKVKIRVARVEGVIVPKSACDRIAQKQVELGYVATTPKLKEQ